MSTQLHPSTLPRIPAMEYRPEFYPEQRFFPDPPLNSVDYRSQGGPKLDYLWCDETDPLHGQQLYLGGEVGSDGNIYYIPGHAPRVLVCNPNTDTLEQIGPVLPGKYKWLRGIVVDDVIYGLPCHADSVLKIHVPTGTITTLPIDYSHAADDAEAERTREWKYHGGAISPIDGCIYAIPQSAHYVLQVNVQTEQCQLIGPPLEGRWKWYGGVVGKQDGAVYGIPHSASQVLRIHPTDGVTLHGNLGSDTRGHQWHGAAAAPDGTIVCVPANADSVLCIAPGAEPNIYQVGDASILKTGRHRTDGAYKYLGALAGTDGKVYCFPCASEQVLQVDTIQKRARNVGPNLYDEQMERLCQNKWQNGVLSVDEQCVYGIPLAAESLLRIDCSSVEPVVTTWPLPAPHRGLGKFEGAVVAPNGVLYTVPNNHKAVLRIEPPKSLSSSSSRNKKAAMVPVDRAKPGDQEGIVYRSGIPTLRSSAHRVKFSLKNRKHDPKPRDANGNETTTTWLPEQLCKEHVFSYDASRYNLESAVVALLRKCDPSIVGAFRDGSDRLEDFVVPTASTWRTVNGGSVEDAQKYLSDAVASDDAFLKEFHALVKEVVLPHLKRRLVAAGAVSEQEGSLTFYYQCPPTLRLQPGPAWSQVKPHNDAEYGHQNGELNFWLPLTDRTLTGVDLWCETAFQADDYHAIPAKPGEIISFHGSSCRHYVNTNASSSARVSMDFRVGVQGFFDPYWQMKGTTDDHGRQEVKI